MGQLTTRIQARYLIGFGWLALTGTMFLSTKRIDLQLSFASATWLRILQYIPLGFVFIPSSTAAYIGIAAEKNNAVAGLVNFMRNIGSSVGTSVVTTLLARRSQFHQGRLVERAAPLNPNFLDSINGIAQQLTRSGLNFADAQRHALARFYTGAPSAGTNARIRGHIFCAGCCGRPDVPAVLHTAEKQSTGSSQSARALRFDWGEKKEGRGLSTSLFKSPPSI